MRLPSKNGKRIVSESSLPQLCVRIYFLRRRMILSGTACKPGESSLNSARIKTSTRVKFHYFEPTIAKRRRSHFGSILQCSAPLWPCFAIRSNEPIVVYTLDSRSKESCRWPSTIKSSKESQSTFKSPEMLIYCREFLIHSSRSMIRPRKLKKLPIGWKSLNVNDS